MPAKSQSISGPSPVHRATLPARFEIRAWRLLVAIGLVAAWQVGWQVAGPFSMASPWDVLVRLGEIASSGVLLVNLAATLEASIAGFFIGTFFALLIPVLLRLSNRATAAIEPYIMVSMGVPIFALAPLLILWFGINLTPKIVITAVTVFYIIFIATMSGLRAIDGRLVSMARVLGASEGRIARDIYWKSIQPFLFAGFRVALPRAIGATIVGEFLVAHRGLGFYIENSRQQADIVGVFVGIVVVTTLILGLDAVLERIYRGVLRWRPVDIQMTA